MGYLDAQEGAEARTAFRTAEKLYKRYKYSSTQLRTSKSRKTVPATDVSNVLDFRKYAEEFKDGRSIVDGVSLATGGLSDGPVFVIDGHPGFFFIPQALSVKEQFHWIRESLTSLPQPPNRTNHNAVYGHITDLWSNVQDRRVLVEVAASELDTTQDLTVRRKIPLPCADGTTEERCNAGWAAAGSLAVVEAEASEPTEHVDKVLVSSDDPAFCQSTVNSDASTARERVEEAGTCWYFVDAADVGSGSIATKSSKPISAESLIRKLRWATIGLQFDWSKKAYNTMLSYKELSPELCELASRLAKPAMNGEKFLAEAAIVNYYGPDDMLGGHVDDMEADWGKPIVSISLGCKAVFLLGGTSRMQAPVAMFIRSGDVVLMAGPARRCFHGVPRIFVDPSDSDLPDFLAFNQISGSPFLDYIKESRINVNVRGDTLQAGDCMQELLDQVQQHKGNIDGDVCTVMATMLVLEGWQLKLDPVLNIKDTLHTLLYKSDWASSLSYTIDVLMRP